MKPDRWSLAALLLVAMAFAVAAVFYPHVPDPVPTHWNLAGEVDGWTPKPWGVWILPLSAAVTWLVIQLLPAISPRGFRMESFRRVLSNLQFAIVLFLLGVTLVALMAASGARVDPAQYVLPATGLLLIVIGNFLGKTQRNFFVGIRTPWTLASAEVWTRTHRVAGWLFVLCGGWIVAVELLGGAGIWWILIPLLIASLLPILYSFLLYRRIEGFSGGEQDEESGR